MDNTEIRLIRNVVLMLTRQRDLLAEQLEHWDQQLDEIQTLLLDAIAFEETQRAYAEERAAGVEH